MYCNNSICSSYRVRSPFKKISLFLLLLLTLDYRNFVRIFLHFWTYGYRKKFKARTVKLFVQSFVKFSSVIESCYKNIFKIRKVSFIYHNFENQFNKKSFKILKNQWIHLKRIKNTYYPIICWTFSFKTNFLIIFLNHYIIKNNFSWHL